MGEADRRFDAMISDEKSNYTVRRNFDSNLGLLESLIFFSPISSTFFFAMFRGVNCFVPKWLRQVFREMAISRFVAGVLTGKAKKMTAKFAKIRKFVIDLRCKFGGFEMFSYGISFI